MQKVLSSQSNKAMDKTNCLLLPYFYILLFQNEPPTHTHTHTHNVHQIPTVMCPTFQNQRQAWQGYIITNKCYFDISLSPIESCRMILNIDVFVVQRGN